MNLDIMTYILMGILFLCGYVFLLHSMTARIGNNRSVPALAIVLFIIYAALAVPLFLILNQMGSTSFVLLAMLLLLSCLVLFASLYGLIRNFRELNKKMLVLFLLYMMAVSYFTIFNRQEGHSRAILLRFDSLREAMRKHSLEPLQHVMLNAVMFIPIGILFPLIQPSRLGKFIYVGTFGLMLSTIIESTQMFLQIGQCDIEDIVANTAGAVLGFIGYKIFMAIGGNREDDDDEDDEDLEEEA